MTAEESQHEATDGALVAHRDAKIGDAVSVLFSGRYLGFDDWLGYHHIAGAFRDAYGNDPDHVEWQIVAHWAADLHAEPTPDLIAENERLRHERDDLMHGTREFVANTVSRQTAALGAEVERLRRERDEARAQRDEWREVVASLGFGDGHTEPQATPEQFQHAMERTLSDQSEWHESQLWRDACAMAGHPDDEDCAVHDPAIRLLDAEAENEYLRLAGETVVAENDALRAQVSRVEALHEEQWSPHGPACTHCRDCYFDEPALWPCATIRALTDAAPPATDPSEQEAGR